MDTTAWARRRRRRPWAVAVAAAEGATTAGGMTAVAEDAAGVEVPLLRPLCSRCPTLDNDIRGGGAMQRRRMVGLLSKEGAWLWSE